MTALNKFKKFMTNLKDAAGKKLKDIFGKVKTFLSNPGNILTTIKTGIDVVKNIYTDKLNEKRHHPGSPTI
jgi:hypothetical protein